MTDAASITSLPTAAPAPTPRRRRRWVWVIVAAIVIPVAVKEGDVLFGENFHTVVPGELYRSAQLSGAHLERHVQAEGIRTVINLRGPNPGSPWYDEEVRTCEALGVQHIDIRISARSLPPPEEAAKLVAALHDAPRPLLVHCKNGADRSGLACAAYLIAERGVDAKTAASDQLHLWYGHMPVGPTKAMDQFFTMYESSPNASAAAVLLPAWVRSEYPGLFSGLASGPNPTNAAAASEK